MTATDRSQASLAALRMICAGLMLAKALPAVAQGWSGSPGSLLVVGSMTVLGLFILVGLATRLTATLAAALMAFVYLAFHLPHGWSPVANGGVPAILSAAIFLHVGIAGPGAWSIDGARQHHGER